MAVNADGFNLIDQPWIIVLPVGGEERPVSILELFEQAPELVTIGGEVPTQTFAITRLLLAFLHRAIDGPKDHEHWAELWNSSTLPMDEIRQYADRVRARFDLFDSDQPFFQVPDLNSEKGVVNSLEKIVADVPNGVKLFTTRSSASLASIDAAEAARWLVHVHAFDPAGIKTGAVDDPKARHGKGYGASVGWSGQIGGVLPEGKNLRETLVLNLIGRDLPTSVHINDDDDRPAWERAVAEPTWEDDCRPDGAISLYTWQTRRVRLVGDRRGVTGVVLANGDKIPMQNRYRDEPHSAWRHSPVQSKKLGEEVYMPLAHDPGRAVWRGLAAMLPSISGERPNRKKTQAYRAPGVLEWIGSLREVKLRQNYVIRMRVIGATYGTHNATFAEIVNDKLTMAVVLLNEQRQDLGGTADGAVDDVENVAGALGRLADEIGLAGGSEPYSGAGARAREMLYAALDWPYRKWLSELREDTDLIAACREWQIIVRRECQPLADELVMGASRAAWRGRLVDKRVVNVALAESWFYASLRKNLPFAFRAADEDSSASGDADKDQQEEQP